MTLKNENALLVVIIGLVVNVYNFVCHTQSLIPQANRLHKVSLVNRIDQTEGGQVKQVFNTDPSHPSYWTQYKRVHDKLGYVLGPGTQKYKPIKQQFNFFTGKPEAEIVDLTQVLTS